jgi:16S rRNA processing protein RimM
VKQGPPPGGERVQTGAAPLLVVGKIARAHGLRGEVSVALVGDDPSRMSAGRELLFTWGPGEDQLRLLRVAGSRGHPNALLLKFEGVETREQAESLAGGELCVRFDPGKLLQGEYYPNQLQGLEVRTVKGESVGRVGAVLFTPGGQLLELTTDPSAGPGKTRALLVPFHGDIVKEVNIAAGYLTIDPPEGLLEL